MSRLNKTEPESFSHSGDGSVINSPLKNKPDSINKTDQPINQSFEKISSQDRKFECSTSLTFVQIVEKFEQQSDSWELETSLGKMKGRVCGKGKPVYFLNGVGACSQFYSPIAWLLKDHYKCVLFDSPLYFPKTCHQNKISIDTLSTVVKEVADFHHDSNVSLFASSFGCMVALNCLAQYQEQFVGALLQGGYSYRDLSLTERTLSRVGRHLPGRLGQIPFYEKIQTMNHRHWLPVMDQGRWGFYQKHSRMIPVKTLAEQVRVIASTNLKKSLSKIQQPVLLIRTEGEGDRLGNYQEELEKNLSNTKTEWIHSCGLIPFISRPHAIAKLIRNYV